MGVATHLDLISDHVLSVGVLNSDAGFDMPRAPPPRRRQPSHFE